MALEELCHVALPITLKVVAVTLAFPINSLLIKLTIIFLCSWAFAHTLCFSWNKFSITSMPGKGHFSWEPVPLPSVDFLGSFCFPSPPQAFFYSVRPTGRTSVATLCGHFDLLLHIDFIRVSEWSYCRFVAAKVLRYTGLDIHIYTKTKTTPPFASSPDHSPWDCIRPVPLFFLFAYYNNTGNHLSPCYSSLMSAGIRPMDLFSHYPCIFTSDFWKISLLLKLISTMVNISKILQDLLLHRITFLVTLR